MVRVRSGLGGAAVLVLLSSCGADPATARAEPPMVIVAPPRAVDAGAAAEEEASTTPPEPSALPSSPPIHDTTERPRVVIRMGAVVHGTGMFSREIRLFDRRVGCDDALAHSDTLDLSAGCEWSNGSKCAFAQFRFSNGRGTSYKGALEVIDAPAAKGATGRIRLDDGETWNVVGGEVDAIVCE